MLARFMKVWRIFLPLLITVLVIIFFTREKTILIKTIQLISSVSIGYLLLGMLVTIIFIILQAFTLKYCYMSIGINLSFDKFTRLYLRRFWIAPFVPGGFSFAQYLHNDYLEKYGVQKKDSILASTIFLVVTTIGFLVVLLPALILGSLPIELVPDQSVTVQRVSFVIVIVVIAGLIVILRGKLGRRLLETVKNYYHLIRYRVKEPVYLILSFAIGVLTEIAAVVTLGISLAALSAHIPIGGVMICYAVTMLGVSASPILSGLVVVEGALTLMMVQFNVSLPTAVAVALLFRFFQFWFIFCAASLGYLVSWSSKAVVNNKLSN